MPDQKWGTVNCVICVNEAGLTLLEFFANATCNMLFLQHLTRLDTDL